MAEIFSFKSDQDSLAKLIWIVLRPIRVYQNVVSKGTWERQIQCQGNIQWKLGNPESKRSLPGLDHQWSSSSTVEQVDSQAWPPNPSLKDCCTL